MTKVLILYYSAYGHMERMAQAVAEGVREAGAHADIKRVPELVPEDIARKSGFKLDQAAPIATVPEFADYDAIIFGPGTRFGVVTSQMRNFLDQTRPALGNRRARGKGRLGVHRLRDPARRPRSTLLTIIPTLLHHGTVVVGLPYAFQGLSRILRDHRRFAPPAVRPYGASIITEPGRRIMNSPVRDFRADT